MYGQMFKKITASSQFDSMRRFVKPLQDHFKINHFWYYKITDSGHYSYFGTHTEWSEFCFENNLYDCFPCLRHPNTITPGISLMKSGAQDRYKELIDEAWNKFQINFNVNLTKTCSEGIEAFGFASCVNDPKADERIINELPTLKKFIGVLKERYNKLFEITDECQINISELIGTNFYQSQNSITLPIKKEIFLKKLGIFLPSEITERELEVLKFLTRGYSASYIAQNLFLSVRTVENYINNLKNKLNCYSKTELIQKSIEIYDLLLTDW